MQNAVPPTVYSIPNHAVCTFVASSCYMTSHLTISDVKHFRASNCYTHVE